MFARPMVNCYLSLILLSGLLACTPDEVDKLETVSNLLTVSAGGESLQGVALDEASGLTVFRGIPFAAPPTGERRDWVHSWPIISVRHVRKCRAIMTGIAS